MISASDDEVLSRLQASELGPYLTLANPVAAYGSESHFCFRSSRGVGFKFILEWSSVYLFSHIWPLDEEHCPWDYKNRAGREVLIFVQSALSKIGVDTGTFTAEMAEEALQAFSESPYDLVITDVSLPVMSGLDLTRKLLQAKPTLPIIIASGYAMECAIDQMGPNVRSIIKPFDGSEIDILIDELTRRGI